MSLFNIESIGSGLSGFRLHKLEVYNWGTFDKSVWTFNPNGKTALLTGDSGSGKSTLVDALTTLLVPPRKISYNKAADASAKERNAKSYVLGYYGRKYNIEGRGKPEALRENNCYSVILATFKNEVENSVTTIAIFSWFKDNENNPSKLYVVGDKELFITTHFANFNSNVKELRTRLKAEGCSLYNDYNGYGQQFRKQLGSVSAQAIDLFQQTISMKKVDALNEFVRESMIEYDDPGAMINDLLKHYENLNVAYQTVVNAQKQIDSLEPICSNGKRYLQRQEEQSQIERARASNEKWFATKKSDLVNTQIEKISEHLNEVTYGLKKDKEQLEKLKEEIIALHGDISKNGGAETERLTQEIKYLKKDLIHKQENLYGYLKLAKQLDLKIVNNISDFQTNLTRLNEIKTITNEDKQLKQEAIAKSSILIETLKSKIKVNEEEVKSLQKRTSNIPGHLVKLRNKMCEQLGINNKLLPFVGEMLEVKEQESKWEGAIERLVHSFAISLLVTEEHYPQVAKWVNRNNLNARLVYFNTSKIRNVVSFANDNQAAVYNKLLIKQDTQFSEWVNAEINHRFNHTCCSSVDEFKTEPKAITLSGQIKSNTRHEKDDRRTIDDRSRFVLGFSNKKKLEVLASIIKQDTNELTKQEIAKSQLENNFEQILERLAATNNLLEYTDFDKINASVLERQITEYTKKLESLQASNSILNTLQVQLAEAKSEEKKISSRYEQLQKTSGKLANELEQLQNLQAMIVEVIENVSEDDIEMFNFLEQNIKKYINTNQINLDNAEYLEKQYNAKLTEKSDKIQKNLSSLQSNIEKAMAKFRVNYPSESIELSESINSLGDYNEIYEQLLYHNLPLYKQNFKQELQGKIIQHIAIFNAELEKYSKRIQTRINEINESLYSIDYNAGRYIKIICEKTPEVEIKNFRMQLKACTEGMYTEVSDDELARQKFTEIQNIIERFKGRSDSIEADKRWMKRVTDVRNWFVFSASESWRESGEEYEHYSDSDGKSGGQKEKLAYTILAASLAYNYRLRDLKNSSKSFRLVVIDEAFLKSSDESAKFGLGLFKQMNFQLLVVTPLLKIATIEPFVEHVGFVTHSDIDHRSKLQNIDKETFAIKLRNS